MSKHILYFPHDTKSRTDKSLQTLLMEEGVAGIGIYWAIIEMLHENDGKMDISLFKSIAFELHVDCPSIERVVKNFDLFHFDEVEFWSDRVNRNLFEIKNKSTHGSIAAKARWDKERNARALKNDAHPMPLNESKVNKSKVNKNIESVVFSPAQLFQFVKESEEWKTKTAVTYKTDIKTLEEFASEFCAEQTAKEKSWPNRKDAISHLLSTFKLNKPKSKPVSAFERYRNENPE